jgi:phosphoglycolate phosphatase-like HAD superfamily hydrolase
MRLLALDFDGVICDSAREAFVVALRTYAQLRPESRLGEDEALYSGFAELMPLGNRAEDYAVALRALEGGAELPDQPSYDAFRDGIDAGWLLEFHRAFYRARSALSEADPDGWLALMGPYAGFLDVLRRRAGEAELAIATSKDRRSVRALLEAYGVAELFPEGRVLDKETGVSKVAHLEHLQASLALPYAEITFVDDKTNHLDSVADLGVRCGLATWGYNGAREAAWARERGYLLLSLADVEAKLFG